MTVNAVKNQTYTTTPPTQNTYAAADFAKAMEQARETIVADSSEGITVPSNQHTALSGSGYQNPYLVLCDTSVLNGLATSTPDYSQMTSADAIQTIIGRYDALLDTYAGTETGHALDYARSQEFQAAGIQSEERLAALKDSYLKKNGYEGLTDNQIKNSILEKYGNARDITEGELYELHRELYEAGLSKWPPAALSVMSPTSTNELKTRVQMSMSGVPITDSSWKNFVITNRETMYTQKIDWVSYWENKIAEHLQNGASEDVVRFARERRDLLLPGVNSTIR